MADNVTPVELTVTGFEKREVMMVDYKFNQTTDEEGQITGIPRGGRITIRVKALNNGNNELLQWMLAETDPRDVSVVFYNTIDGSLMKSLEGKNCYCVHYKEMWEDGQDHYEQLEIVCQELLNGPVAYQNPWR